MANTALGVGAFSVLKEHLRGERWLRHFVATQQHVAVRSRDLDQRSIIQICSKALQNPDLSEKSLRDVCAPCKAVLETKLLDADMVQDANCGHGLTAYSAIHQETLFSWKVQDWCNDGMHKCPQKKHALWMQFCYLPGLLKRQYIEVIPDVVETVQEFSIRGIMLVSRSFPETVVKVMLEALTDRSERIKGIKQCIVAKD